MVLTHLTKNIDNLIGIIEKGFRVKYCYELLVAENNEKFCAAFPMISFTELEMYGLGELKKNYGNYGISLSKHWAERNALNPVIYLEKNSKLLSEIKKSFDIFSSHAPKIGEQDFEHFNLLNSIFSYSKNFNGDLYRLNKPDISNFIFANEREWRLVINDEKNLYGLKPFYFSHEYLLVKDTINKTIGDLYINFDFSDISAIHIDSLEEKENIANELKNKYSIIGNCTSSKESELKM